MGRRLVEGKKDADKDRAELIAELNALRDFNSRLKEVVKRYEKVAGKKELYSSLYDLESDKESIESLRNELQGKQLEADIQGEEISVQNEELRVQLDEINARTEEIAEDKRGVAGERGQPCPVFSRSPTWGTGKWMSVLTGCVARMSCTGCSTWNPTLPWTLISRSFTPMIGLGLSNLSRRRFMRGSHIASTIGSSPVPARYIMSMPRVRQHATRRTPVNIFRHCPGYHRT